MTTISKVQPDFEQLVESLRNKLSTYNTWVDMLPTAVGTTLLDIAAGTQVTSQYYLDVNLRESFLPLAVRDSSIFAGTRMLGVNIARKVPASFTAEIVNNGFTTHYIQPFSVFDTGNGLCYTRAQYVIPPGSSIANVNLYLGEPKEKIFPLDSVANLALKEFYLGVPGFVVSTADIIVFTRNRNSGQIRMWTKTDKAIFEHTADDFVYFESTSRDGDVSLFFGDGTFGRALTQEEDLVVQYVETTGAAGNNGLPGVRFRSTVNSQIEGESLTPMAGGADEKSAIYYKQFAPHMHRTKRRSISGPDIRGTLMEFPGVADAAIFGQRHIAPNDSRWQNVIRICVLPENQDDFGGANPHPKSAAWQQIIDELTPRVHYAYRDNIQAWNPKKLFVDVRVRIALMPGALEGEIQIAAMEAILKLFQKKPGILGRRLSKSDIDHTLRKIVGVDYVIVDSPIVEIVPEDNSEYVVLNGAPDIKTFYSERALSV